jgi:DNA-binding transcriptional regulator YiaG
LWWIIHQPWSQSIVTIVNTLKDEIRRLAKREAKAEVAKAQKAATQYRAEVAKLKRQLRQREREIRLLRKHTTQQPEEDPLAGVRFSARSVRSQRNRLGLSIEDYAKLVGVAPLTLRHWEDGTSRPRRSQLAALVTVRNIGKREALARLAKLP